MYRFYISEEQHTGDIITVTGEDVNHIKNVLRLAEGDEIILCNATGIDYICRIKEESNKNVIICDVTETKESQTELPTRIVLYQGLPKKDKMELIIQKCVELGVTEIVPVAMKRCIVKIEDDKSENKKNARWAEIARAAAKQSGRGIIPVIGKVMSYKEAMKKALAQDSAHMVVPYENAEGMISLKNFSNKLIDDIKKSSSGQNTVSIFIGPEGGFDETEIQTARDNGCTVVSLGKRILRTETAGFTTVAVLMYEMECMNDSIS